MKLKYNFLTSEIAGQKVAVPIDCEYGEQSIIKTNETGAYILDLLKTDITTEQIIAKIKTDFKVKDDATLKNWVNKFISKLEDAGVLINE